MPPDTEKSESKEADFDIRVLIVDRSQTCFLSRSMTISREISSEKEFDVVEDRTQFEAARSASRWHFLYFLPLPHQHGSLRPSFFRG